MILRLLALAFIVVAVSVQKRWLGLGLMLVAGVIIRG